MLVNKKRRKHSRSRVSMTSPKSWWNAGTKDMSFETLAGGIAAGFAASVVPRYSGYSSGWAGILAAGVTVVVGSVLIGKYVSGKAAVGFGIVGGTIVANRALNMGIGMAAPALAGTLSNAGLGRVGDFLGRIGQTEPEIFGQTEQEIFGVETYGWGQGLEPTYMGHGTHLN